MATRKRKTTKKRTSSTRRASSKKEAPVEHELPGGFWRQTCAVLMIALALFFVITWFGHGGSALNAVHDTITKGIGLATYFIPVILVYNAVRIFRAENNRISIAIYIASILMLLWLSGVGAIWNFGGIVGSWLNGIMTQALDQAFVIIIYIVLIFITLLFILQLSPLTFFKGTKNLGHRSKATSQDKAEPGKKKKLGQLEIKVNSGLTTDAPAQSTPARSRLLHKNSIKAPA